MERLFFYIWFLYRRLIFRIFKRVDHSNGLTFTLIFFGLLPLPVITILILIFRQNNHLLALIYMGYAIICYSYVIFLSLGKKDEREKYFKEFNSQYNSESRIKRSLIMTSLFYPLFYIILLVLLKIYFH